MLIAALLAGAAVLAQTFTLPPPNPEPYATFVWDAPDSAIVPPSMIDHYKVYWGIGSSTYTNFVRSTNTSCSVTQFVRGQTYFAAATTVTTNGLESTSFSNEVSWKFNLAPLAPATVRIVISK
jgi:hypothetical protein